MKVNVNEHAQELMQEPVSDLANLLLERSDLREALAHSIDRADRPEVRTIDDFFDFLNTILTHIPTEEALMPSVREFYYLVSHSPDGILRKDKQFNDWMMHFVKSRGNYLDTPASAGCLETFINNPAYKVGDYIKGPSGWLSFNQFLARQLKPGKRPVDAPGDNTIIVSPVDGMWKGQWAIESDSTVTVKGKTYSIKELVKDSTYLDKFEGGIFMHIFLSVTDYHRYHLPVDGIIREVLQIPGGTWVNEAVKEDGSLENTDDVGFQFTHTRACLIIESVVGFVAVIPVGMGHISSTVITAETGTNLRKGDEFGFFAFGGSDIIMLFQEGRVALTGKTDVQYKQGQQIGYVLQVP